MEEHKTHLQGGSRSRETANLERHHVHLAERQKKDLVARLKSVEGHVRGVQKMVEEDEYCVDILKQTRAVQKALDKVNAILLENHLHNCATTVIRSGEPKERERVITELLEVFDATGVL